MTTWKKWNKTLPTAEKIYQELFGEPETHVEWANKFNKVGVINKILYDRDN